MIAKELKANLKGFIILMAILIGMFLFVYLIYPFIITDEAIAGMEELLKVFPEELLKAFNLDVDSLSNAYGWFKSEGGVFALLAFAIYASILGIGTLLKEEKEKTIDYLISLPIKRKQILTNKIISSLIYIISMVVIFTIFNLIALTLTSEYDIKEFLLLSVGPLLVSIPMFFLSLFISTILKRSKGTVLIALGLSFVFYFINLVSQLSSEVEALKYLSLFSLADVNNVMNNDTLSIWCVIISILISALFALLSYVTYDKKEFR